MSNTFPEAPSSLVFLPVDTWRTPRLLTCPAELFHLFTSSFLLLLLLLLFLLELAGVLEAVVVNAEAEEDLHAAEAIVEVTQTHLMETWTDTQTSERERLSTQFTTT